MDDQHSCECVLLGALGSPSSYIVEITTLHLLSPETGLSRTMSCFAFPADDF